MPIRFRCTYCNRLLGIATRKAGTQTRCPHCGYEITVPTPQEDDSKTQRVNLDDVEQMLGQSGTATATESAVSARPAPPISPPPPPPPALKPKPEPLDLPGDEVEPAAVEPPRAEPHAAPKPPPVPKTPTTPVNPANPAERPLFEGDVDEILGVPAKVEEDDRPRRRAASGTDASALNLAETPRQIVLSAGTATLLMVLVVVLIGIAFAAGYFLAPR
jgi:phage FluMu protein Com